MTHINEQLHSLHPTQQKLYELLAKESDAESLTLRDMAVKIDVISPNTVEHHLRQLEKKGYIFRDKESGRIKVMSEPVKDIIYLNLYGFAECGPNGFFAEDNVKERVPLPAKKLHVSKDAFLVEAKGASMEPAICEGDLVLAEKNFEKKNGIIAVVLHEDSAKIKKFFEEQGKYVLQSLNPNFPPIVVGKEESLEIIGIVKGVIRRMQRIST